jgi:hypothetical protein
MNLATGLEDVMKLTDMMVVLGRFISKLGEKGLPFFKMLKMSDRFKWTEEVDQALEELKTFLTTPLVMVPRHPRRPCYFTSPRPPRWSAWCWWLSDLKKATSTLLATCVLRQQGLIRQQGQVLATLENAI